MKESLLQYAWQHKLYKTEKLISTNGESISVIHPGLLNTDAGPDFFNAKIQIGNTLWAGNVEIHLKSSDWNNHHHGNDAAYDNIILHVVFEHDTDIFRSNGKKMDQIQLPLIDNLENRYEYLMSQQSSILCAHKLPNVPSVVLSGWLNALLTEKLELKIHDISTILQSTSNNWEEAFYIILARNFGSGINAIPFEMLAKSLPQSYLAKHKDNLLQIEAMLFGQSGLLNNIPKDEYTVQLNQEYKFLRSKYNLSPVDAHLWKFLRLRPQNFPHIRIAQLAHLIHSSSKLFSKILTVESLSEAENLFRCATSDYWQFHYTFTKASPKVTKQIGINTIRVLLINTVIPFLFAYGKYRNDLLLQERAIQFLEQLPTEHNSIIEQWQQYGILAESAFDSQALLFLKKQYCDHKKCLQCRIGHTVLCR